MTLLALFIGFVLCWAFVRAVLRPLEALAMAAMCAESAAQQSQQEKRARAAYARAGADALARIEADLTAKRRAP
ncbi:hypothetical protein [Lysobacter capsici]|uniref:hypothetical protein n=1 Tax=Lysobacter capsici TaxID=435897 RepID=UPI001C000C5F|nr:hypothetical protein [Lysobacter capsici]QWF19285.1 hypothetical protein KME82_11365 [Lysobacter capsici]